MEIRPTERPIRARGDLRLPNGTAVMIVTQSTPRASAAVWRES